MPKYAAFALVSSSGSTSAGITLKSVVTPHATSTVPSRKPMKYRRLRLKTPAATETGIASVSATLRASHAMRSFRLSARSMRTPRRPPKKT